jgi:hypothetical protein
MLYGSSFHSRFTIHVSIYGIAYNTLSRFTIHVSIYDIAYYTLKNDAFFIL